MTTDIYIAAIDWQSVIGVSSIAGVLVGVVGFYFVFQELKLARNCYNQAAASSIYNITCQFYRLLVESPELRKYFYDPSVSPPEDPILLDKLFGMCEYIADILELILGEDSNLDTKLKNSWDGYAKSLAKSQIFLRYMREHSESYTNEFKTRVFGKSF